MANFSDDKIKAVWEKAQTVEGFDSTKYRKDTCGAWIVWTDYGKESLYGWEIDHCLPVAKGGTDHTDNLQPLQWQNNRAKADDFPSFKTAVIAQDKTNIEQEGSRYFTEQFLKFLKQLYPNNPYLHNI